MTKRAFLVMGPPSSGTRLMTRLLIAADCVGDGDHHQRFDDTRPTEETIAFRRHYPTERTPGWAASSNIIVALQSEGYTVHVIIMNRDWHCTIQSMLAAPHAVDVEAAYSWLHNTWQSIFDHICDGTVDFNIVSYESLVQRPNQAVPALMAQLGLELQEEIEPLFDGNAKYYEQRNGL